LPRPIADRGIIVGDLHSTELFEEMPKTTKARRKGTNGRNTRNRRTPRTPLQLDRLDAMNRADGGRGITQRDIIADLQKRGTPTSQGTVWSVVFDRFDSDDVISSFCRLTGTTREKMFPGTAAERREAAGL
jgi:hypothetical protein